MNSSLKDELIIFYKNTYTHKETKYHELGSAETANQEIRLQILEFSDREYKISMATMFKDTKQDTENMLKNKR